jgi:hypothetical protein
MSNCDYRSSGLLIKGEPKAPVDVALRNQNRHEIVGDRTPIRGHENAAARCDGEPAQRDPSEEDTKQAVPAGYERESPALPYCRELMERQTFENVGTAKLLEGRARQAAEERQRAAARPWR